MSRQKRYVTEDGSYVAIDECHDGFYLAWYFPDTEDFGAYIGEDLPATKLSVEPTDKESREIWTAHFAAESFADEKVGRGFLFETEKAARLALRAVNEALFNMDSPWPEWALRAKEAGWTPPEGWKP